MKESILGRSRAFVMRMVALTGFILFIGVGTTVAQNYVPQDEAISILRTEIDNLTNSVNASPFEFVGPEMFINTNPQIYANWYMMAAVNEYLNFTGPTANVREAIEGAYDKGVSLNAVNVFYFTQASNYLEDLLTN